MILIGAGIIIVVLLVLLGLQVTAYDRAQSRYFVERQQLQGKIDTLTEHALYQAGRPIDLNKKTREVFKRQVHDNAFRAGWKSDGIATPPMTSTNSK